MGWTQFFVICTALAVPGMLMLFKVAPWNAEDENAEDQDPDDTALVEAEEEAGS